MQSIGDVMKSSGFQSLFTPISESLKQCEKHGIEYTEKVFKHYTQGCPECERGQQAQREVEAAQQQYAKDEKKRIGEIEKRVGASKIPPRFVKKTVAGYELDAQNEQQSYVISRIKQYALEFSGGNHSGRCLALLGNAGTGKTHLACAVGNHVMNNCNGQARFTSVSEINRLVRESKSFSSAYTESQIIEAFGGYDLLIIDEVGVQSGTEAESRALFDVFNERYQNMKPTILISNLAPAEFVQAVGGRIADRVKEDGGEVLIFNWESHRG